MHTNKFKRLSRICIIFYCILFLISCGNESISMQYNVESENTAFVLKQNADDSAFSAPFATQLCVTGSGSETAGTSLALDDLGAAALFNLNSQEVIYAKNAHAEMHPASLTKIMTALVALQHGNPDDIISVSANVKIQESGATLCGLEEGDKLTLSQALYALLMNSANDAGVAIAEHIGGSVEGFAKMMNDEAKRLGATNTNFKNPHGLTEDGHYTTAYDLYLIFNEAVKYDAFNEIISATSYTTTYTDKAGNAKQLSLVTTNQYLKGVYPIPENITIIGGKTGTTTAARNCLILLCKDASGNPYVAVILGSPERGILYEQMTDLLNEINK